MGFEDQRSTDGAIDVCQCRPQGFFSALRATFKVALGRQRLAALRLETQLGLRWSTQIRRYRYREVDGDFALLENRARRLDVVMPSVGVGLDFGAPLRP